MEEAKGVEGERACETPEFIQKLMARDRLQVTPPHSRPHRPRSPPILSSSGGGGTNKSGGLYDQTEDKKGERESEGKHVFSPGTPAAARQ